jgi:hypothetical protein
MKSIIEKSTIIAEVFNVSKAYARVAGLRLETADSDDLCLIVSSILRWHTIQCADPSRVTDDAAFLARFEAANFAEKLLSRMSEPIGITGLATRLGIIGPAFNLTVSPRPSGISQHHGVGWKTRT